MHECLKKISIFFSNQENIFKALGHHNRYESNSMKRKKKIISEDALFAKFLDQLARELVEGG